jgi:predicted dehydrogenase
MPDFLHKVSVIGCGFGAVHMELLQATGAVQFERLVYHKNQERAEKLAAKFGFLGVDESIEKLLLDDSDVVVITSPVASHAAHVTACLRAKKSVVCDKPLAMSYEEARFLEEYARKQGVVATTFFQWRHHPGVKAFFNALLQHELGALYHLDLQFRHDFLANASTAWPWRHKWSTAGAGAFGDQGVHLIDLALWAGGSEGEVMFAEGWQTASQRTAPDGSQISCETEDVGTAILKLKSGLEASIFVCRATPGCRELRFTATAARGTATITVSTDDGSYRISGLQNHGRPGSGGNPYQDWLAKDSAGLVPGLSLRDGVAAQRLLDEIQRSFIKTSNRHEESFQSSPATL